MPFQAKLTMRVLVMKAAIPNPEGIKSNQRCHDGVRSFQQLASRLANMALKAAPTVSAYNLPVLRIILVQVNHHSVKTRSGSTHQPASRLPVGIAIWTPSLSNKRGELLQLTYRMR